MSSGWIRDGELARRELPEYDLSALREILINAEAHRKYLLRGTQVELGMYDDRIEVISFGGLEYGMTIEEILKNPTSSRRNPLISDILSRLDFMERRGSGIAKIMDAYRNDYKKPKLEIIGNMFIVTIYSRLYKGKTSENIRKHPKTLILEYIKENKKVSKKYILQDLNLTEGQVKHALKVLKETNQIESVGKGKSVYYIIKKV